MQLFSVLSTKTLIMSFCVILLSGCGFHMRGEYSIPEQLTTLSMTSHDQYSTLTRLVKKQLTLNNITLVTPASDIPNLRLKSESVSTKTISIYQNTRAAEKSITLNVSYQVTIPEVGNKQLSTSVTRSYLDNPLTALAKSVEKAKIINEMRQIAASQIIRQMARLKNDFSPTDDNAVLDAETSQNTDTSVTTSVVE